MLPEKECVMEVTMSVFDQEKNADMRPKCDGKDEKRECILTFLSPSAVLLDNRPPLPMTESLCLR
jgi:hypothetical protein